MLPPPPVAIFPPAAAMLPRGPPQFAAHYPPPIFYWPYPSPPVSPTNYYNPANVGGIAAIPQQAALLTPAECLQLAPGATVPATNTPTAEPRIEAFLPRMDLEKRVPVPAPSQAECNPFVEVFMV
ncbi:protein transport protein sec31 [Apis mellifera caucasica]|uniref:Protein transport protein sec31 n=1 Tax=Apis mellifera TaxID=7460 RepID=A0A7M7LMH8_APIME|nr:protein transport protein sec31 [Apis mellifera]KAG6802099.1 protein transport protein sec31 [Apis mellifera caucasica]KAG9432440.1 protein transport protein sec31 [Apis mellifera carnica]|eukprot:XP_006560668.1 protein transport protein sec31 [Apis mellifera]